MFGEGGHVRGGVSRGQRIGFSGQGFARIWCGFILRGQGVIGAYQGTHVLVGIPIFDLERVGASQDEVDGVLRVR